MIDDQENKIKNNDTIADTTIRTIKEEKVLETDVKVDEDEKDLLEVIDNDGKKHLIDKNKITSKELTEDENEFCELDTNGTTKITVHKQTLIKLIRDKETCKLLQDSVGRETIINKKDPHVVNSKADPKEEHKCEETERILKTKQVQTLNISTEYKDVEDNNSDSDIVEIKDIDNTRRFITIDVWRKIKKSKTNKSPMNVIDLNGSAIKIIPDHKIIEEVWLEVYDMDNNKILIKKKELRSLQQKSTCDLEVITDSEGIKRRIYPHSIRFRSNDTIIQSINNVEIKQRDQENLYQVQSGLDETVEYVFSYKGKVTFGDAIYVTGSCEELGGWMYSIRLDNISEDKWLKVLRIKHSNFPFEYKYFISKYNPPLISSSVTLKSKENLVKVYPNKWLGDGNILVTQAHLGIITKKNELVNRIFTINTRYLNTLDGINIWDNRKEILVDVINRSYCDFIGLQEIKQIQLPYLDKQFNGVYYGVGLPRSNNPADEQCRFYYNHQKFYLEECGQFWLSSSPDQVSITYGNHFPRIATWAKFSKNLDLINGINGKTNNPFYYLFNTHLDHLSEESRVPCVDVLLKRIQIITETNDTKPKIIFITGCFYSEDNDQPIRMIKDAGFTSCSDDTHNNEKTFHEFTGEGTLKIDYIFYKTLPNNLLHTNHYEVIPERIVKSKEMNGGNAEVIYPSDHFPIFAEII